MKLYMFRTVRLSIIRSLFTVHSAIVCAIQDCLLSETCRASWQNKFFKLVHLVGFITKKFVTMHGHMNVRFVNYPFLYFLPFCRHYLCVHLLLCFLHSMHVYNCALYTVYRHTLYSSLFTTCMYTYYCVLYTLCCAVYCNCIVLTMGQYTPCAHVVATVLHTLNTWALATLICPLPSNLPFEANHFVSELFLLLVKKTGIHFGCVFLTIFCHFCL